LALQGIAGYAMQLAGTLSAMDNRPFAEFIPAAAQNPQKMARTARCGYR